MKFTPPTNLAFQITVALLLISGGLFVFGLQSSAYTVAVTSALNLLAAVKVKGY